MISCSTADSGVSELRPHGESEFVDRFNFDLRTAQMAFQGDMFSPDNLAYMELAIQQAKLAMDKLEVPIGCVFVEDGKVIASGSNRPTETRNASRHAEMEAIDILLEKWQRDGLSAADVAEKFRKCVFSGISQKRGFKCTGEIMASEAVSLLRSFYEQGNPNAPKPHRPVVVAED